MNISIVHFKANLVLEARAISHATPIENVTWFPMISTTIKHVYNESVNLFESYDVHVQVNINEQSHWNGASDWRRSLCHVATFITHKITWHRAYVKGIKNGCPCNHCRDHRHARLCLCQKPAWAVDKCRDIAKAQPLVPLIFIIETVLFWHCDNDQMIKTILFI